MLRHEDNTTRKDPRESDSEEILIGWVSLMKYLSFL